MNIQISIAVFCIIILAGVVYYYTKQKPEETPTTDVNTPPATDVNTPIVETPSQIYSYLEKSGINQLNSYPYYLLPRDGAYPTAPLSPDIKMVRRADQTLLFEASTADRWTQLLDLNVPDSNYTFIGTPESLDFCERSCALTDSCKYYTYYPPGVGGILAGRCYQIKTGNFNDKIASMTGVISGKKIF